MAEKSVVSEKSISKIDCDPFLPLIFCYVESSCIPFQIEAFKWHEMYMMLTWTWPFENGKQKTKHQKKRKMGFLSTFFSFLILFTSSTFADFPTLISCNNVKSSMLLFKHLFFVPITECDEWGPFYQQSEVFSKSDGQELLVVVKMRGVHRTWTFLLKGTYFNPLHIMHLKFNFFMSLFVQQEICLSLKTSLKGWLQSLPFNAPINPTRLKKHILYLLQLHCKSFKHSEINSI